MAQDNIKNPKKRRTMRILLIGSLALNLLVIGVVGGAVIGHSREDGKKAGYDKFGTPHVRALSSEDKRSVGKAIRTAYRKADIDRLDGRGIYQEMVQLLRNTPLDLVAFEATIYKLDNGAQLRREVAQSAFVARIVSMNDAERAAYADRLETALTREGPGKSGPKQGDGKPPRKP